MGEKLRITSKLARGKGDIVYLREDLKVVIMGDHAVGKTSLVLRYSEGKFCSTESTIGASFVLKQWGPYNVALWDTAGEEKFSGLSSFYCRSAGAAILAFDICDTKSFESLWARFRPLMHTANEDCLKVVIGTKLDLVDPKSHPREITMDEAEGFAREINQGIAMEKLPKVPYFETSSLSGHNVDEVFTYILNHCLPLSSNQRNMTPRSTSTIVLGEKNEHTEERKKCGC